MKSAKEYRGIARESLKGSWWKSIGICLLVSALPTAINGIPVIGSIASLIVTGPLAVGAVIYFVNLLNKKEATINNTFEGFKNNILGNIFSNLLMNLYIVLWSLLFVIPGLVKSYSYAMTMYVRSKNPELGYNEAITLSRKIMNGKKAKLFGLQLSFIGWYLLCILSFGIGFIFLAPYIQAAQTAFFEDAYNAYQPAQEPVKELTQAPAEASTEATETSTNA